jgi:Protein of unknown function (DUF1592)/Protein of unknown function (DUF1588)/Protein of unknown function (DUF1595)/Protein of unknown function (DUF1587)/Protein of unknown function (DUF1585)
MQRLGWSSGLLTLAMAAGACIGNIGGDEVSPDDGVLSGQQGLCEDGSVKVAAVPLRRLTNREYDNAVRDLLDDDSAPASTFVPDEKVAGFDANAVAPVTKLQVQDYLAAAEAVTARVVAEPLDARLGCAVSESACVEDFLVRFGRRAFRRPLTSDERNALMDVYADATQSWDAIKGFELLLQTVLMSPQFLYQLELDDGAADGEAVALDGYAIAARLASFLWQSVPDDALLDAAERGDLDTRDGIAAQAQRMLDDPRAEQVVASFFGQWLEIEHLDELLKDADAFPGWSPELARALRDETLSFADRAVRQGGTLETLLTASYTYGDDALAAFYGADAPDADGKISLDPSERAGLLTQGSFLASRSHAQEASWVFRGKFVRENLLCDPLPPPPPGVDMNQSNDPDRLVNPECAACHVRMDPIGFGFDQYDAIGQFDASEGIDDAELIDAGPLSGPFDGPVDLAQRLADSDTVRRCVATHFFRFATRRADTDDDSCSLDAVDGQFAETGQSLQALLIAITQSDGFRFRRAAP